MNLTQKNLITQPPGTTPGIIEYFYLLWQWIWLIVLTAILAGGTAYVISRNTTPVYQTTMRLLVSNPPSQSSIDTTSMISGASIAYMTQTYSEMITDSPVMDQVISELGLQTNAQSQAGDISVSVVLNTQIISVSVENTDPNLAATIANKLGDVFPKRIQQLQSDRYKDTLEGLLTQRNDMAQKVADTQKQLDAFPKGDTSSEKSTVQQTYAQYQQLYNNLVLNYEQVRLAEAQTSTTVTVVQPAPVPTSPISPKTSQNTLLAAAIGLLLSAGTVFTVDALDDTIKNPEELRQKFGLPILGVISRHISPDDRPITLDQPRSPVSESFRTLRTNITYASVDTPLRWIMVTSPTPQDGKTTICSNLGVVFAQGGKRAVVVDGDLRRPMENSRFGLENNRGLSELFVNRPERIDGIAQPTAVEGLSVVTSGSIPPNPAELMASRRMLEILELLSTENDLVLIDTPPVLSVTDAAALAPGIDGVIIVAKPGVTRLTAFRHTLEQLQSVGAKVLGVVLNEVEPRNRKYGYYYHRYYSKCSYYYSANGAKKKVRPTPKKA